MVDETEKNLYLVSDENLEMGETEILDETQSHYHTNPIARKLLDFSLSNKTRKFSVRDLFRK